MWRTVILSLIIAVADSCRASCRNVQDCDRDCCECDPDHPSCDGCDEDDFNKELVWDEADTLTISFCIFAAAVVGTFIYCRVQKWRKEKELR